jgi:predicted transcriptional regulator
MADKNDLISPGNIAKELGVSDGKVKKAIKDLGLEPAAKRGVCSFYSRDAVARIKAQVGG